MEVNMNEDANTLILRECYEKFVAGDIPGMLEHFSEDIVFIVPEVENAPYGGIWHGKKAVAEFFTVLAEVEDINDFEARDYIAAGDRVGGAVLHVGGAGGQGGGPLPARGSVRCGAARARPGGTRRPRPRPGPQLFARHAAARRARTRAHP